MNDVANFPASLIENHEFITACARYGEGLLSEEAVKKKFRFDDDTWASLGDNEALVEAIEAEKARRIRSGATARERAQVLFARAPDVLGTILDDGTASPRHRIEAARELRQVADNGPYPASPQRCSAAACGGVSVSVKSRNGKTQILSNTVGRVRAAVS